MVMSRFGIQRRRSRGWWGVFLCACLAMGVYIGFDVLDLDGSEVRNPLPGNAIVAEAAGGEAERFLTQDLSIPEASKPVFAQAVPPSASTSPRLTSGWSLSTVGPQLERIRPRVSLRQETTSPTSTAGDPA